MIPVVKTHAESISDAENLLFRILSPEFGFYWGIFWKICKIQLFMVNMVFKHADFISHDINKPFQILPSEFGVYPGEK